MPWNFFKSASKCLENFRESPEADLELLFNYQLFRNFIETAPTATDK